MDDSIVIVGAGQAGAELAFALRQEGHAGPIVLVGAEAHLPYQRPPLSKAFLNGKADAQSLLVRAPAAYEKAGITLRLGTSVERMDRENRCLVLADGQRLPYARLALATGGSPRPLAVPGHDSPGVFLLRGIDDARRLREGFLPGRRLVIVGAGYVGLEVAAVAVVHGLAVTVLESAERVLPRVTAPLMSAFYETLHRQAGVDLRTGVQVLGIESGTDGLRVCCADGTAVPADMVLVAVGLLPETRLAEAAGLAVHDGIVVDELARTSDPSIVAVGDCANHFNDLAGRRLRLESVQNAMEQARSAAATLCGRSRPYQVLPWFWSDQYGLKLQMVGFSQGHDQTVLRGSTEERSFICFYLREGAVVAADAVNRPADFMLAKRLIAAGGRGLGAAQLADTGCPLAAPKVASAA